MNSALKDLERRGFIDLQPVAGNRRNKLIMLTAEGERLVDKVITPLIQAEQRAFERMGEEDYQRFLTITRRHVTLLKEEIDKLSLEKMDRVVIGGRPVVTGRSIRCRVRPVIVK